MAKRGPKPKKPEKRGRPRKHPLESAPNAKRGRKAVPFLQDPDRFVICLARVLASGPLSRTKAIETAILAIQTEPSLVRDSEDGTRRHFQFQLTPLPAYGATFQSLTNRQISLAGRVRYLKAKMRGTRSFRTKPIETSITGEADSLTLPPGYLTIEEVHWQTRSMQGIAMYLWPGRPGSREFGLSILHHLGWNLKNNPFNTLVSLNNTPELNLEFLTR